MKKRKEQWATEALKNIRRYQKIWSNRPVLLQVADGLRRWSMDNGLKPTKTIHFMTADARYSVRFYANRPPEVHTLNDRASALTNSTLSDCLFID